MLQDYSSIALQTAKEAGDTHQWVHLLPAGTFSGRDGRGPYHVSDAQAVMRASQHMAGPREIPIDYEHQTDLAPRNGKPAPAAGWIDMLTVKPDGIWGSVRWTATAASFLACREYRYLSPVFNHTEDGTVTRLLRAALTNYPALNELTALARTETSMDTMNSFLDTLRQMLGLPADAGTDDITAKIGALNKDGASSAPDPAQFVPMADFAKAVAEIRRLNQGISAQAAEDHVSRQVVAGALAPALREWGVALCSVNKPAFDAFLESTGPTMMKIITPKGPFGRAPARENALSPEEEAVCQRMGLSEEDLRKARAFSNHVQG